MSKVRILDTTLRDGGYINKWMFGKKNINEIVTQLSNSNIDYIECGYFNPQKKFDKDCSIYTHIKDISTFLPLNKNTIYTLMINFEELKLKDLSNNTYKNFELRIAFKPQQLNNVKDYIKPLLDKNYKISLNPMHTSIYSIEDVNKLCQITNELKVNCLTVVDTMGIMTKKDTINLFQILDNEIISNTNLGFHSHNNLQLSYSNTKELIKSNLRHNLIIDSCILGIGRGAGILPTELIAQYQNEHSNSNYDLNIISTIANKYINPLEKFQKWGYSYPYYLSAKNKCHPNYAKYLIEHTNLTYKEMNRIFSIIPNNEKINYNEELLKKIL